MAGTFTGLDYMELEYFEYRANRMYEGDRLSAKEGGKACENE
jgi:hypothetical protein